MEPWLRDLVEDLFGVAMKAQRPVSGGCIASAYQVVLSDGRHYFVKSTDDCTEMFRKEANGLSELAQAEGLRVPGVIWADNTFLVMEWLESNTRLPYFMELLGQGLAKVHRRQADAFGLDEDNFIGATPQINTPQRAGQTWPEFYWEHRMAFQLQLAEKNGYATPELRSLMSLLENKLEAILSGSEEPPSLIHGDLWSGNVLSDEKGEPCIFDPAVYYGHREAELGMTHLFGGFSEAFYRAYHEAYPLQEGHEYRRGVYKLYHVLNHLNLFGRSYYGQAIEILRQYQ